MSHSKSTSLTAHARDSKKPWPKPKTLRQFTDQVNAVASLVLSEEIDLEKARTYSSLARTVAQTMSIEVTRARFTKAPPNLDFEDT